MKYNNLLKRRSISAVLACMLAMTLISPVTGSASESLFDEWDFQNLSSRYARQAERLDRGVTAIRMDDMDYVFVSWRLNGYEPENAKFNVYRDGKRITSEPVYLTNYQDSEGDLNSKYSVGLVIDGEETERSEPVGVWENQYLEIKLAKPPKITTNAIKDDRDPPVELDEKAVFTPNDTYVADLNGDSRYDFVVKLVPSNQNDAMVNIADKTYLDGYTMEGEHLWRIDIGPNIRTQRHGIQPLVYDFDGDGKAEIAVLTGDGAVSLRPNPSGNGTYGTFGGFDSQSEIYGTLDSGYDVISVIGDPREVGKSAGQGRWTTDRKQYYLNQEGPLYLSIFDGETGEEIQTIPYDPQTSRNGYDIAVNGYPEGPVTVDGFTFSGYSLPDGAMPVNTAADNGYKSWSDKYPNHPWRMNSAVAYLNGETPGMIFQRGIYSGRVALAAYTLERTSDGKRHIVQEWRADSYDSSKEGGQPGFGGINAQGNHNVSVGDLDGSGRDSIIIGASAVKYDGTLLWNTKKGHGDAQHLGKYDPTAKGYQYMTTHERGSYGFSFIDASSGKIIWNKKASADTGRGIIGIWGDFDGAYAELSASEDAGAWAYKGGTGASAFEAADGKGLPNTPVQEGNNLMSANFRIYWDGDLWDEAMDGYDSTGEKDRDMEYGIYGYNEETDQMERIFQTEGCTTIDFTKKPPCAVADIFGDWREEFITGTADHSAIRIYTTVEPTDYRYYTFMHDALYSVSAARQCSGYNQPPHIGFYLADREGQRDLQPSANVFLPNGKDVFIDEQPQKELVVMSGDEAPVLEIQAKSSSGAKPEYQWYETTGTANKFSRRPVEGTPIPGATGSTYKVPENLSTGEHYYYCVVSADGARDKTSYASKVMAYERPIIEFMQQPLNAVTVYLNEIDKILSVQAEVKPAGTPSYQWYRTMSPDGSGGVIIPGATDATLSLPGDLKLGTYYYYCLVRADGAESVKSRVTAVTVDYRNSNKFDGNNFKDTESPWLTDKGGASAGLTATVITDPEDKIGGVIDSYLNISGGGTGGRVAVGKVKSPQSQEDKVFLLEYDIKFESMTNGYADVGIWPSGTTNVMSTNPIFRLTRTADNELYWSVNGVRGQHKTNDTKIEHFSGSAFNKQWIRVNLALDYEKKTGTVKLTSLDPDADEVSSSSEFSLEDVPEGIGLFGVAASRSSGTMNTKLDIANVAFYTGIKETEEPDPGDLPGAVESIALDETELKLQVGDFRTLMASVTPLNAKNVGVTWGSSDTSVATVDADGRITAVSDGEAVITVKTDDGGKTADCSVVVGEFQSDLIAAVITDNNLKKTDNLISGDLSLNITNGNTARSAAVILAIYNEEGKLTFIEQKRNVTLNEGDNPVKFEQITIPNAADDTYRCRVFVWDSINGMHPLCNACTDENILK